MRDRLSVRLDRAKERNPNILMSGGGARNEHAERIWLLLQDGGSSHKWKTQSDRRKIERFLGEEIKINGKPMSKTQGNGGTAIKDEAQFWCRFELRPE